MATKKAAKKVTISNLIRLNIVKGKNSDSRHTILLRLYYCIFVVEQDFNRLK